MANHTEQASLERAQRRARRAFTDLKHGGHVIPKNVENAKSLADKIPPLPTSE
jgi:hypothetical protein